jgi:hypothetical protein
MQRPNPGADDAHDVNGLKNTISRRSELRLFQTTHVLNKKDIAAWFVIAIAMA